MSEKHQLNAEVRPADLKVEAVRDGGQIPAIMYGHDFDNQNLVVDYLAFEKLFTKVGESSLVDLSVGGEPHKVLVQDVQHDPVTDKIIHADFRRVRLDEKVKAEVTLKFVGEAPAVKEYGAVLNQALEFVEVEALPQDLVHEVEVDQSVLSDIGQKIYIKDLKVPETLTVLTSPDVLVAGVDEAKVKEEKQEATPEEAEKAALEAQAGEGKEGDAASAETSADKAGRDQPDDKGDEQKGKKPAEK